MIEQLKRIAKIPLLWVFPIAFGVRFYLCLSTAVINPDGIIYIQQARAIYYQQWGEITACGMKYLSLLPPMIAAAFTVLRDWETAGRFISLLFGTGTLIPLYFILKRFFDRRTVGLTLLVYAFIPALAERSADIIRGPIYWFFLASAMLMVLRHRERRAHAGFDIDLQVACILFLVAAWARIEASFFLILTGAYLLFTERNRRIRSLSTFLAPLALLAAAGLLTALLLNLPLVSLLRLEKPIEVLQGFAADYRTLRTSVDALSQTQEGYLSFFLQQAGDFVWIVPLGPLLDSVMEKFFYPYVLIFLAGFPGLRQRLGKDPRVAYFVWLCIGAVVMLYLYTLRTFLMYDRFLINLILPAVFIVGCGCENLMHLLHDRVHLSTKRAAAILAAVILLFGLGKNVKPRYAEKRIFPRIAAQIVDRKTPGALVRVAAGPSNAYNWVFFYANLDVPGSLCNRKEAVAIPANYQEFIAGLETEGVCYVLWSAKTWPREGADLMAAPWASDFELLGKWNYDRKDDYLLLRRKAG